jgi:hypothetical protein
MAWVYTFHRFADQAAYQAVIVGLGWQAGAPPDVALDVVGTLYNDGAQAGTDPDTGAPIFAAVAVPGWHVNAAWRGMEMPAPFVASQITVVTPERVWA